MGMPARLLTRARAYGRERVPREGGVVLAINHLHWIDIPIVGALSPRNLDFVAKVEAANFPVLGRFIRWHGTIAVRRGESDREAVRAMRQVRSRAAARSASSSRDAPAHGPAREGAAGRGDGRDPGRGAGRAGRDLRDAVLEARQLRAVLDRLRASDRLLRPAEERARLQGGDGGDRAFDQPAVRLARRACTRRAGRRARLRRERQRTRRHRGDRRLPERRQVDARQPADRHAPGRGARDARRDARPQGARGRVERQALPADRHRRRRHRRSAADHARDRRAGTRGGRRRRTWSCSSSTRASA